MDHHGIRQFSGWFSWPNADTSQRRGRAWAHIGGVPARLSTRVHAVVHPQGAIQYLKPQLVLIAHRRRRSVHHRLHVIATING